MAVDTIAPTRPFLQRCLLIGATRDRVLIGACLLAVVAFFLAYIARLQGVTHDAFHEMALARAWHEFGRVPTNDIFAYTPTVSPTVHHEWLTGFWLYWSAAVSPLGLSGMIALKLSLIAALWVVLYRVARGNGAHPLVFAVLSPIVFPLMWVGFATVRAQLLTLVAIACLGLLLQSDWRGRKIWLIFWLPLYLVWLNVHAGFVVGVAMFGLHVLERHIIAFWYAWRMPIASNAGTIQRSVLRALLDCLRRTWHLYACVPLMAIGLLCNPWGYDYVPYLIRAITMPRPTMAEWQPLWRTYDAVTTLTVFAIAVGLIFYVAHDRRWERLRGWLLCLLAAYMAFKHIRHGSLFAVIWLIYVPAWVTSTSLGKMIVRRMQLHRETWIRAAVGLLLVSVAYTCWHPIWLVRLRNSEESSLMSYPVGATAYLEEQSFRGNVMAPFQHGAYLSWRLYPKVRVSIDGRYEVAYQSEVLPAHDAFYQAMPGWRSQLARYATDLVVIPTDTRVYQKIHELVDDEAPEWRLYYRDDDYVLIGKADLRLPSLDRRGQSLAGLRKF